MTMILSIVLVLFLAVVFLVWSCASVRSGVWGKTVCRNLVPGKAVLTFDDGPDPSTTPLILDILKDYGLTACFFVVGEKAQAHPDIVRRMVEDGHIVGNHSFRHAPLFPLSGVHCMETELKACDSAVAEAIEDIQDKPELPGYFRPPFGVTNPDIARTLRRTGHTAVGWSIRSFDTVLLRDSLPEDKAAYAAERCVRRIVRKLRPGSVILLHDRLKYSPLLLKMLLDADVPDLMPVK